MGTQPDGHRPVNQRSKHYTLRFRPRHISVQLYESDRYRPTFTVPVSYEVDDEAVIIHPGSEVHADKLQRVFEGTKEYFEQIPSEEAERGLGPIRVILKPHSPYYQAAIRAAHLRDLMQYLPSDHSITLAAVGGLCVLLGHHELTRTIGWAAIAGAFAFWPMVVWWRLRQDH